MAGKLTALEKEIEARLDVHESAIVDTLRRLMEEALAKPLRGVCKSEFRIQNPGFRMRIRRCE